MRVAVRSAFVSLVVVAASLSACGEAPLQGFGDLLEPYESARDEEKRLLRIAEDRVREEEEIDPLIALCRSQHCSEGSEESEECVCCDDASSSEACTCILNPALAECRPAVDDDDGGETGEPADFVLGCRTDEGKAITCRDKSGKSVAYCKPGEACDCDTIDDLLDFKSGIYTARAILDGTNEVIASLVDGGVELDLLLYLRRLGDEIVGDQLPIDGTLCLDTAADREKPGQKFDSALNGLKTFTVMDAEKKQFRTTLSGLLVPGGFHAALPNDAYADIIMEGTVTGPECLSGWVTLFLQKSPLPCPAFVELVGAFVASRIELLPESDDELPPCLKESLAQPARCPSSKPFFEKTGFTQDLCTVSGPACPAP